MMDPNETLRLLRLTIKQLRVDEDPGVRKAHADEIADYFDALDEWLSRGGFPPEVWREGPDAFGEANPDDEPAWLYDSGHYTEGHAAARVSELSAARPDAKVETRKSEGGLFEVWIFPES
jgi:hypothetical protein